MTHKNYIEVAHEWDDSDEVWDSHNRDFWHAVRPTPSEYAMARKPEVAQFPENQQYGSWKIEGKLDVYSKHDVAGLRKLLDAIEEELNKLEEK